MKTTHIIKDRASGLFFHDLADFSTGIALTKMQSDAMRFSDESAARQAVKTLRSEFGSFDFIAVERA